MTVLVTGGAGYIGSHMVLELLDAGEEVVVLDDLSTGFRWAVPPEVTLVVGRRGRPGARRRRSSRSTASTPSLHFAAAHRGAGIGHRSARLLSQQHGEDPRALIETAVKSGVKNFIFSSTAAVYGEPEVTAADRGHAARADQPLWPLAS